MPAKKGTEHHYAKLSPKLVAEMREWYADGVISILELAHEFGVSYTTCRQALRGQTWKDAPFPAVRDCPTCCGKGRVAA